MRQRQTQTEPPENNKNNPQDLNPPLKSSEERIKELEKKNRSLYAQVCNLKAGLGSKFLIGRRRMVTYLYGKEITAYLHIKYVSVKRAKDNNAGKSSYLFLYRTNAILLADQLGCTIEAATKTIKFLNDVGAWRLVKTETTPGKIYTYQIGERKKFGYTQDGERALAYVNKFYFTLYPNSKSLNFYKKEIKRLMEIQTARQDRKTKQKNRKIKIEKLGIDIQKKLKSFYDRDKQAIKNSWNEIFRSYENQDDVASIEILQDALEEIKEKIEIRNREKFNPYTGTNRSLDAYKKRSGKYKRRKIET